MSSKLVCILVVLLVLSMEPVGAWKGGIENTDDLGGHSKGDIEYNYGLNYLFEIVKGNIDSPVLDRFVKGAIEHTGPILPTKTDIEGIYADITSGTHGFDPSPVTITIALIITIIAVTLIVCTGGAATGPEAAASTLLDSTSTLAEASIAGTVPYECYIVNFAALKVALHDLMPYAIALMALTATAAVTAKYRNQIGRFLTNLINTKDEDRLSQLFAKMNMTNLERLITDPLLSQGNAHFFMAMTQSQRIHIIGILTPEQLHDLAVNLALILNPLPPAQLLHILSGLTNNFLLMQLECMDPSTVATFLPSLTNDPLPLLRSMHPNATARILACMEPPAALHILRPWGLEAFTVLLPLMDPHAAAKILLATGDERMTINVLRYIKNRTAAAKILGALPNDMGYHLLFNCMPEEIEKFLAAMDPEAAANILLNLQDHEQIMQILMKIPSHEAAPILEHLPPKFIFQIVDSSTNEQLLLFVVNMSPGFFLKLLLTLDTDRAKDLFLLTFKNNPTVAVNVIKADPRNGLDFLKLMDRSDYWSFLKNMDPKDLAKIVTAMTPQEVDMLLKNMPKATMLKVFSFMKIDDFWQTLDRIPDRNRKVAAILVFMPPSTAAKILIGWSHRFNVADILEFMPPHDAGEISKYFKCHFKEIVDHMDSKAAGKMILDTYNTTPERVNILKSLNPTHAVCILEKMDDNNAVAEILVCMKNDDDTLFVLQNKNELGDIDGAAQIVLRMYIVRTTNSVHYAKPTNKLLAEVLLRLDNTSLVVKILNAIPNSYVVEDILDGMPSHDAERIRRIMQSVKDKKKVVVNNSVICDSVVSKCGV